MKNLRNIDKKLKYKSNPMKKINNMLQKLGVLHFAMSLNLNMGYYSIRLWIKISAVLPSMPPG